MSDLKDKALNDKSENVRYSAVVALGSLGEIDPASLLGGPLSLLTYPAFQALGDEASDVRSGAVRALKNIYQSEDSATQNLIKETLLSRFDTINSRLLSGAKNLERELDELEAVIEILGILKVKESSKLLKLLVALTKWDSSMVQPVQKSVRR